MKSVHLFRITNFLFLSLFGAQVISAATSEDIDHKACRRHLSELTPIAVAYTDKMSVWTNESFSPSAGKPSQVVQALVTGRFPIQLVAVDPVSRRDFKLVHDPDFVDRVLTLQESNGFGNKSVAVAESLFWTTGSLLTAARQSLREGVAMSPTSGFHHAGYSACRGFCTFNGLMVVAKKLLDEGYVRRVAIVDADRHPGDGTQNIIDRLGLQKQIFHYSFGQDFQIGMRTDSNIGIKYLTKLQSLEDELKHFRPDLIIYQAGADPHIDDPLGGILTTKDLEIRDETMFRIARDLRIPIVWNLAGGYQRDSRGGIDPVIQIHLNTLSMALEVFGRRNR